MDKLVDENLQGVVTLQTTSPDYLSSDGQSGPAVEPTIALHKVLENCETSRSSWKAAP